MPRTVVITFKVPAELAERLDELINSGFFSSRSEALRRALILLLKEYQGVGNEAYNRRTRGNSKAKENN